MATEKIVVLNVDDYEAGRYATSRVLRQAGYEVMEAGSGEEALTLSTRHPDLIVLDVNLPDINGFEVCRAIKSNPETSYIPVLYLSAAYRGAEHRVRGLDVGADGYLTQPVDPRELVATVNALLRARHVRDAVERSEERFRSLMTATTDIVWTTDAEGGFVTDQQDWREFTGQSSEESAGWGWLKAVHPQDRDRIAQRWRDAVQRAELYEVECRLRRHDGEHRDMLVRAVPVLEEGGTVREWVGACTDITEQKAHAEALHERNERLQLLSEAANRLLLTDDPREYIDHLFQQLSSYLDLEVYLNYLAAADGPLLLNAYRGIGEADAQRFRHLSDGETVSGWVAEHRRERVVERVQHGDDPEAELLRAQGITAYACFPLLSHDQLIGTLSFGTRTREHFQPDELSLMHTVCDQVAVAVERARLIRALQERATALEEANRAKADFLATMSHELRTPLNAMIGYTDLLQLGVPEPIPPAAQEHVGRIRTAALHLSQLIEEVLTHARLEAGRDELDVQRIALRSLVDDVAALIAPLAEQKRLSFRVVVEGVPDEVDTDPRKLRQILLNLLGNAVKFTEQGGVELALLREEDQLLIRVRDTGIGIAANNLERIFEPFWQVDGTHTRVAGGTGLGLGVVRQLAERLGGDVSASSAIGQGSEFVVRLPLRVEAAAT